MEISSLTVKLIILLVPGLISYFIYRRITIRETKRSDLMFIVVSILLGFLSYASIHYLFNFFVIVHNLFSIEDWSSFHLITLTYITEDYPIQYDEVAYAILSGTIIAVTFGKMDSSNIINRLAYKFRVTEKLNDQSIYNQYLLNDQLTWVYVRDIENNLTYLGAVALFSDKENDKEIVLNDVTVYTFPDSQELYKIQSIYLNFGNGNIILEEAKLEENEQLELPL
ncbi:hypothetical protein FUA48_08535 [Flavobacterium alkalisoli]|uniref:Uncharacterized protein n=1 Tax=Flavobacterium alkalisoli TaxID=2602769 RepID=A0A5B9FY00_9FLAO|nr:hypothetical protein [Flavobacterium alkalisoli]QEE49627.1 hypothetical protein FUA48_08535 [Flavobacterium alkalisoli]